MRETGSSQPGTRCALVSLALLLGCHGLRAAHPAPEPPAGPATTEELITFVDRAAAELQAKDLYVRRVRLGKQTLGVGSGLFVE